MTHGRNGAYRAAAWSAVLLLSTSCKMPNNPMRAGAASGDTPSLVHNLILSGRAHADGFCRPADNCSACHGADLKGLPACPATPTSGTAPTAARERPRTPCPCAA
jgi:hypothetical protein